MSRPNFSDTAGPEVPEGVMEFLGAVANVFMWLGGIATLGSICLLIAVSMSFTTGSSQEAAHMQAALANVGTLQSILVVGLIAFGVGSAFRMWGEPQLPVIHVILALVIVLAPTYMPMIPGLIDPEKHPVGVAVLSAFQSGGTIFSVIAAVVLIIDISFRIKERMRFGMKADQLKFGKGIKEEVGAQNVFMGKCWQLPYCRKFVRERCPIYHAKKACWREKVGCMCEEEVIRAAMENRAIPRDAVAAAKYIPLNNKLTYKQKAARCRQCVIYNEHQKHKYRLGLFVLNIGYLAFVVLFWVPLNQGASNLVHVADKLYSSMTFQHAGLGKMLNSTTIPFTGLLLGAVLLIVFTYCLKTLEYAIFKLKL